jgi:hypothetical protein
VLCHRVKHEGVVRIRGMSKKKIHSSYATLFQVAAQSE